MQWNPSSLTGSFDGYRLIDPVGSGGMAEVFRAVPEHQPDRLVAIKRIRAGFLSDPVHRRLLLEEAKVGQRLRHPNIIRVIGTKQARGNEPYIVMELVEGIDLKRLSWAARRTGSGLPTWAGVHIMAEVLAGLGYAHGLTDEAGRPRPVIHRDVSPENILLGRSGRVVVADFGVAVQRPGETPRGKVPYMAPELFSSPAPVSPASDLFSVGVVLWELLTGRHLFRGATPREAVAQVCAQPRVPPSRLNPSIPRALDGLVLDALSADPARRPASALEMRAALLRTLPMVHAEGAVTAADIAALVEPHRNAARLPREATEEDALDDIDRWLEIEEDDLFTEPTPSRKPASTSYAIIHRPSAQVPAEQRMSTDDLLRDYLQDAPIEAPRGTVDTLDIVPGAPGYGGEGNAADEPHPVWEATPHGRQGPMRPSRAFSYLRDQPAEVLRDIQLSADGIRWVTLARVAYLLDDELVTPSLSLSDCEMQGRLSEVSTTAVLGTFSRSRTAARLVFARAEPTSVERFEVQVLDGHAVAIHNNQLFLSLWSTMLGNPDLGSVDLAAAFHETLRNDRQLLARLPQRAAAAVRQASAHTKRRALEQLFTWQDGSFGSSAKVTAARDAGSADLHRLLPRLVAGLDNDRLHTYLSRWLDRPLWRAPDFEGEVGRFRLRRGERLRAEAFGHGRTLFESLEFANAGRDDPRYGHVLAYLFLELGLINETNPQHVATMG